MPDSPDDRLRAFQDGDEAEWRDVVAAHSPWLYVRLLRMTGSPAEAEDALQEALIQAFRKRHQLREWAALPGWLGSIASRLCLRRLKRRRFDVSLESVEAFLPQSAEAGPERRAAAREELERVLLAMQRLSPRQRACLTLAVFEDMKGEDIAAALGLGHGAVRRYIHEARENLRRHLQSE